MEAQASRREFDRSAAITRSLLGWGVVVGPLYVTVGLALALTRDGFDLTRHPLSVLMLAEAGWIQSVNVIVSGLLTLAAAYGFFRAMSPESSRRETAVLLATVGIGLVGSGIFPPDPAGGFPPGAQPGEGSASGILHLSFGALQFLALAAATQTASAWMRRRGEVAWAGYARLSGLVVLVGFIGGAALSASSTGVALLWLAVVTGFAWTAATSVYLWHTVPHPDPDRRTTTPANASS